MITIEYLAPYLPYGIKVKHPTLGNYTLTGYRITNYGISLLSNDTHIGFMNELKLVLRDIGKLTDDEWMQVFRSGLSNVWPKLPVNFINELLTIEHHDKGMVEAICSKSGYSYSFEHMSNSFSTQGIRFNQLAAFNELYKLHADLYYLIDKGLAIDVNALNVQL